MSSSSLAAKTLKFFAGLVPSFERSRIVEDVDALRSAVRDNLLPAFRHAAALTASKKFASEKLASFNEVFALTLPEFRRWGYFEAMLRLYTSLNEKLDLIDRMVPELFAKDVTKESMTYRKASILQYLSIIRFVNEYSSRCLLRLLAAETLTLAGKADQVDRQLTPAEIKWLDENQAAYMQALKLLAIPTAELSSALETIPEITIVPERFDQVAATVGLQKLDPLRMGFIGNIGNPIYFVRAYFAERQVEEYKRQKELKRALELRLMALKEAQAGKTDARLQQQIEYTEARIARMNSELAELERQWA